MARYLHLGSSAWQIDPEIEKIWSRLEADARASADARGDSSPLIFVRTDKRASGALPVNVQHPAVFNEDASGSEALLGTIVEASGSQRKPFDSISDADAKSFWEDLEV